VAIKKFLRYKSLYIINIFEKHFLDAMENCFPPFTMNFYVLSHLFGKTFLAQLFIILVFFTFFCKLWPQLLGPQMSGTGNVGAANVGNRKCRSRKCRGRKCWRRKCWSRKCRAIKYSTLFYFQSAHLIPTLFVCLQRRQHLEPPPRPLPLW